MSIITLNKAKERRKELPIIKAMLSIFLPTLLISGTAYFGFFYYQHTKTKKKADSKYDVIAIVQSSQSNELLQTEYLAELLGLSVDIPTNLYAINTKKGEQQLLRSPLIRSATLRKVTPGTLFVNYTMRQPIAYLGDLSNTAIDDEGTLFPFKPFFTPKSLPTIILGSTFFHSWKKGEYWGHSIQSEWFKLAKEIVLFFENENCGNLETLDLKCVLSESLGKREVVVTLKDKNRLYLRLPVDETMKSLEDFRLLYFTYPLINDVKPQVIDLRLKHRAVLSYSR